MKTIVGMTVLVLLGLKTNCQIRNISLFSGISFIKQIALGKADSDEDSEKPGFVLEYSKQDC